MVQHFYIFSSTGKLVVISLVSCSALFRLIQHFLRNDSIVFGQEHFKLSSGHPHLHATSPFYTPSIQTSIRHGVRPSPASPPYRSLFVPVVPAASPKMSTFRQAQRKPEASTFLAAPTTPFIPYITLSTLTMRM